MLVKVLVIEDEPDIRKTVEYNLTREGYEVSGCGSISEAKALLENPNFSIILLDLMLPDGSGLDLCKQIKSNPETNEIPILILTAKDDEVDKVVGFELGADDYVTKPFSQNELIARIKALLRRTSYGDSEVLKSGRISIDFRSMKVLIDDKEVHFGPKEFKLLKHFIVNEGRVFSRSQLLDQVWGRSVYVEERTVDVHIRRLRSSLEQYGLSDLIQTVRGCGYRFSHTGDD